MKDKPHEVSNITRNLAAAFDNTRGVGGILTRLWYQIIHDLGLSPNKFEYYLAEYVDENKREKAEGVENVSETAVAKHLTKGNFRRELLSNPGMTFKSFIRGMRILRVYRIRFIVELHRPNELPTIHETTIVLSEYNENTDDQKLDTSAMSAEDVARVAAQASAVDDEEDQGWKPPEIDPTRVIRR